MADVISRLKLDSGEFDSKIKRAGQELMAYSEHCKKMGLEMGYANNDAKEFAKALGSMQTTTSSARGKINELTEAFVNLKVMYKNMTDEEKNNAFGKNLAASLDQLKTRIDQAKTELNDVSKELGNTKQAEVDTKGGLEGLTNALGINVKTLVGWGSALAAGKVALDVAKDAFFASETSLDEWGRTVQSSQSLYQGFLSALNNSDISGFLSRIDEIISAARDAYNVMDELGTFSAFQQRNVAKGRAGYAQALDEYRLNPTADNKQKLQQANQKVMNDLRESHDKTEAAYQAALRQIATERIKGKDMQDAFVKMFSEGNYGDLQAAKSSYKTGRGLNSGAQYYYGDRVYNGRIQDRSTGKWRDMSDTEKQQFEFARALSQVNDLQIKEVQALGAQSVAITEQIYQQDRAYNRLAGNNAPLKGGGSGGGKGGKSGKTDIQFADDSIMAQEKLISDLTQKWKTASGELRDGYLKDLDAAKEKLKEMTAVDTAPTFTMEELEATRPQSIDLRGNEGKAQDKLDIATAAFATSGTSNVDFSNYTAALQNAIKDANIGSELYAQLSEQLSDSSQVSQLLQQYVSNGITGADLKQTAQELKDKLMNGEIDDDVIQQYVDELNAKLMEKFDEAEWPNVLITFDADTKNIVNAAQQQEKEAQKMAKNWQAAGSAIQAVGAAMNQIEDPAAKVLGTIAQAVATMALSYSQAAASPAVTGTGWGWIAFAATGVATMLSSIAAIKQATAGFANGGVIPGNSLSGDNLRGITPDGSVYGLNAGEVILNRAQANNLANDLSSSERQGTNSQPYVTGETVWLGLNNYLRAAGYGEIVTTNRR